MCPEETASEFHLPVGALPRGAPVRLYEAPTFFPACPSTLWNNRRAPLRLVNTQSSQGLRSSLVPPPQARLRLSQPVRKASQALLTLSDYQILLIVRFCDKTRRHDRGRVHLLDYCRARQRITGRKCLALHDRRRQKGLGFGKKHGPFLGGRGFSGYPRAGGGRVGPRNWNNGLQPDCH